MNAPSRKRDPMLTGMCSLFFIVFVVGGVAAGYFTLWKPISRWQDAKTWTTIPCRIVTAEVAERPDNSAGISKPIFSARIRYSYQWQGTSRESESLTFSGFTSHTSGERREWEDLVKLFPTGSTTTCLVNPQDPAEVVLDSRFPTTDILIGAGMTLVFVFAGLLFLVVGAKMT